MKPTLCIYGIQNRNNYNYPGTTHDHSLCIMIDGQVHFYVQLERLTRRKYDNRMHLFIEEILEEYIGSDFIDDCDVVFVNSFVGNCFISKNGRLRFECAGEDQLSGDITEGKLWVEKQKYNCIQKKGYMLNHELAHVFSNLAFYQEFNNNSLLIHMDGGASLGNFSAFLYRNNKPELLECHWELSEISKFFNDNALTFSIIGAGPGEHCSVPGKLMGYAALGTYRPDIGDWLEKNDYFKSIWNDKRIFFERARHDFSWHGDSFDNRDPFLQDIAATFQVIFQKRFIEKISFLKDKYKPDYLYLSGGCALNIVTNTEIVNNLQFRDVYIPPCCNDSGLSIGGACFLEWRKGNDIRKHSPYLNNYRIKNGRDNIDTQVIRKAGDMLTQGKIIGISNGYGEAGPRALGNRSLLALADSRELAAKISRTVKGREWYRPLAPVMLEKYAKQLTGLNGIHHLSEYMLLDFNIPEQYRKRIEGVVHYNGTARIQTLFRKEQNPFLYKLLTYLDENYSIPALINTSFNGKGEPIVHTDEDARLSSEKMNLDLLINNNTFISKDD